MADFLNGDGHNDGNVMVKRLRTVVMMVVMMMMLVVVMVRGKFAVRMK